MKIGAVITLRTDAPSAKLLALPLVSQVEGVGKFALLALFAQAALVMLADQMADATPLLLWHVMPVWARGASRTVAFDEVLTDGLADFGGRSK